MRRDNKEKERMIVVCITGRVKFAIFAKVNETKC